MKASYKRKKGQKGVNELLDMLNEKGFDVQSVDASGAIKRETGDIILRYYNEKYSLEAKREHKLPIKGLESKKDDSDILVMREDNSVWKVYMDLDVLISLLVGE